MSDLNDFGFSTVSEEDFKASSPEGKVVEEAVEQAKSGQIKTIEGQVDKIWKLLDYHYDEMDKHKEKLNKEYSKQMAEVEALILPLLNNLAKSTDNEYIYWPGRREILEKQIEKITVHTRDINIFTAVD